MTLSGLHSFFYSVKDLLQLDFAFLLLCFGGRGGGSRWGVVTGSRSRSGGGGAGAFGGRLFSGTGNVLRELVLELEDTQTHGFDNRSRSWDLLRQVYILSSSDSDRSLARVLTTSSSR